jgi:hypothetical protein
MADPVSWLMIERGWGVAAADGEDLGTVDEVMGDTGLDIFDGLAVSPGALAAAIYVPAERVGTIVEGRVQLELSKREFESLQPYTG